jgi:uncharacterized protein DUF6438
MNRSARIRPYLFAALAAAIATACSSGEQGVITAQKDDPVIVLSEGACFGPCPIYDMTLHPDGAYILNGQKFVKDEGITEGKLTPDAWADAEKVLANANFWSLKPKQTHETLSNCQTDAPTAKITWRTAEGKEKTVEYNAGCGVPEMQQLVGTLRETFRFNDLVWTDAKFDPSGHR